MKPTNNKHNYVKVKPKKQNKPNSQVGVRSNTPSSSSPISKIAALSASPSHISDIVTWVSFNTEGIQSFIVGSDFLYCWLSKENQTNAKCVWWI